MRLWMYVLGCYPALNNIPQDIHTLQEWCKYLSLERCIHCTINDTDFYLPHMLIHVSSLTWTLGGCQCLYSKNNDIMEWPFEVLLSTLYSTETT